MKFLIIFLCLTVISGGAVLGYRISQEYPLFALQEMKKSVIEEPSRPLVATPRVPIERLDAQERERLRLALKININTASSEELQKLPFIGPKRAEKIIASRPYARIEDITRVHGIGPKTFEKIKDRITVTGKGLDDYVLDDFE
ncbi:helix-hairpin-helix domain-containing protein [candidate division NPL-UPA2 bacterium Unc8]|uniref:Helix-hairpin-helix domain-containing protein n=1 Tax=candidate division NPL-UPA2 bacterium Unc8 TaxID=1980939 RepID=A0A399FW94_UNCN2|nr:ComE operon protein 1 [Bacillota bacterium]RIH99718.1 MAG: helix-hairpin-helix domain-containing protein [candidate division NPL-UPA2 bacterium Unc8]